MENILGKLKESIDFEILSTYNFRLLEQKSFVPISVKDNTVYVVITPKINKEEVTALAKADKYQNVKFIQIQQEDMENLLAFIKEYSSMTVVEPEEEPANQFVELEDLPELPAITMDEAEDEIAVQIAQFSGQKENVEEKIENLINQPSGEEEQKKKSPMELFSSFNAPKKRIGEILLESGVITQAQLEQALKEGKQAGVPIGSMLYRLKFITLKELKAALQKQQGYDAADISGLRVDDKVLSLLPEDFIKANKVLPISSDGRNIIVGMINPNDTKVLRDIVYLSGQQPKAMLITYYEFQKFINSFYDQRKKESSKKETKEIIQQIEEEVQLSEEDESLWEQVERELQDSTGSVAKFVNKIVTDAIDTGASDVHIEPRFKNYVVRYRIDGLLKHVVDVPTKVEQAVLTRFKVLARINIAEHRRPQDGSFSIKYKGNSFDLRINTLPVMGKEKIVIRILAPAVSMDYAEKQMTLAGATKDDIDKVKKMITCPNGIILTSGPTGSGKTTTLYSLLGAINEESVNITTIEDPIEIKLEGVNQSQVNEKAGITFASCLRSILRQDPDVILVGEIRDYETLEVAISAALTGHLVLSTVHTNSAAATVTRLIEMGAKDYLVSSTLSGIIAQRLVRKLCDDCKESYFPTREEAEKLFVNEEDVEKFMQTQIYRKTGCSVCEYKGYRGRLGVFEIMVINKEIKKLVAIGAHDIEIEEAAVACGMKTLHQACLGHILRGGTTIEEFVRVLGIVNE